jgi:hypothetical protein
MMTTFEKAEPGDKVWSPTFGWGHIVSISTKSAYPLLVQFFEEGKEETFTFQGQYHAHSGARCLFWDEVKIEAPKQPARMKLVHGVKIPDISFQPKAGEDFYYPNIASYMFVSSGKVDALALSEHLVEFNMCYPYTTEGRAAAVLHAKAMLGIKE